MEKLLEEARIQTDLMLMMVTLQVAEITTSERFERYQIMLKDLLNRRDAVRKMPTKEWRYP